VSGETGAAALAGLLALADWSDTQGLRLETGLTESATALVLCTEGATDPDNYRAVVGKGPGS
jgi:diaminopropionate ammonia-lyase